LSGVISSANFDGGILSVEHYARRHYVQRILPISFLFNVLFVVYTIFLLSLNKVIMMMMMIGLMMMMMNACLIELVNQNQININQNAFDVQSKTGRKK